MLYLHIANIDQTTPSKISAFSLMSLGFVAYLYSRKQDQCYADADYGFFKSGSTISPHPDKAYKGGEDALAVKQRMISVADGVGGWSSHGVDVAKYSKQLMRIIWQVYDDNPDMRPYDILFEADKLTTETGTSTAVIAVLDPYK